MGQVGGGGGRPSMGMQSRPNVSRPNISQPVPSRPNFGGGGGGPSLGSVSRPNISQPNISRPNINVGRPLPGTVGGGGGFNPGSGSRPVARPLPGNVGGGGVGGGQLPPNFNRPTTRPSFPNQGNGPSLGAVRPTPLPGVVGRPGGNLPGGQLPGGQVPGRPRPPISPPGGGYQLVARPIGNNYPRPGGPNIGGPNFGGNTNINNNINNVIVGNRPAWDRPQWNNPNWGWGGGGNGPGYGNGYPGNRLPGAGFPGQGGYPNWNNNWAGQWHNNCIHNHYGWYNGCWNNYWSSSWYRPVAWGAVGWGLNSFTNGWGYGSGYYNPYYSSGLTTTLAYDYSQPIVVNQYRVEDSNTGPEAIAADDNTQGLDVFDRGLAEFKQGQYAAALGDFEAALRDRPNDPVVHEVRALTLFAMGRYGESAAVLNALLSSAPGMDWTTMSGLYGDVDIYTKQLRSLEAHVKANPTDAPAAFVLAYHYLVTGAKEQAVRALRVVTTNQPKDATAKRMLDSLAPSAVAAPAPELPQPDESLETNLVGTWEAKAQGAAIELTINADSTFTWKASPDGGQPVSLDGSVEYAANQLGLQTKNQGTMTGTITPLATEQWKFSLQGAPANDPGLTFTKATDL